MLGEILKAMFVITDENGITPIFCWSISLVALNYFLSILYHSKNTERQVAIASSASTNLTSLGILGTFTGIFVGLFSFDIGDLQTYGFLLEGLMIAFSSSVLGLGFALLFRIFGDYKRINMIDKEIDAKHIHKDLERLESAFEKFSEKVIETSSDYLVQALNDVIKDFNNKIRDDLGENFKKFNEGIGTLDQWQKQHKEDVEKTKNLLGEAIEGIKKVENSLKSIESSVEKIPVSMNLLSQFIAVMEKQIQTLEADLSAFDSVRERAAKAIPEIKDYWKTIDDEFQKKFKAQISKFETTMEKAIGDLEQKISLIDSNMDKEVGKTIAAIAVKLVGINKEFIKDYKSLIESITKSTQELHEKINEEVQSARGRNEQR